MNFVFVSLQRINTDRESTSTSLARELSKHHKVLYVNPPLDRKTVLSKHNDNYTQEHLRIIRNQEENLTKLNDNLWAFNPAVTLESINWIPSTPVFCILNKINNRRYAADIRSAIKRVGFKEFIIVNDKDIFRSFYLKELLKPQLYFYLDRDFTLGIDYWKKHGKQLEPELMRKSDAVICNSLDFTKNAKRYNPNSFYIGNGCNLDIFDNDADWPMPGEMKDIPHPIVGYVGIMNIIRLDLELTIRMVEEKKDWSFVFIGIEDEAFANSALHQLPNAHFLGKKHTADVPGYIRQFDVCINPQIVNEITIGNFPLKIVEYLAMGKTVVATETNTMREVFSEQTYMANNMVEFSEKLDQALEEDSPAAQYERVQFSKNYSWAKIVGNMLACIPKIAKS